jgi:CHAD domain-containing protein
MRTVPHLSSSRSALPPAKTRRPPASSHCRSCFQRIALHCLEKLESHHGMAVAGLPDAIHSMRIELTRLRATFAFFAPIVSVQWRDTEKQLKWLNRALGKARDSDVAVKFSEKKRYRRWACHSRGKLLHLQRDSHRRLARKLGSARYRNLIATVRAALSDVFDDAPPTPNQLDAFCGARLRVWREIICRQMHRVRSLGPQSLHQLRILSKYYRYMVSLLDQEMLVSCEDLLFCQMAGNVHETLGEILDLRLVGRLTKRQPPHLRRRSRKLLKRIEGRWYRSARNQQ